jgi:hypothetical protein
MKPISTFVHGIMDYLVGTLLILLPYWVGFEFGSPEQRVMLFCGIGAVTYSLITDYELSLTGILSMRAHLALDTLSGLFLAASPWIFGFNDIVYLPHLLLGIMEMLVAGLTQAHPIRVH